MTCQRDISNYTDNFRIVGFGKKKSLFQKDRHGLTF